MLLITISNSRKHTGRTPAITGTTTLVLVVAMTRLLVEDVVIVEFKSELIVVCIADSDGVGWMYTLVDI